MIGLGASVDLTAVEVSFLLAGICENFTFERVAQ